MDEEIPPALREATEGAVAEALRFYRETHSMDPRQEQEATHDFRRFYIEAIRLGCPGIRWNFDGCLLDDTEPSPRLSTRVLVVGEHLMRKTGGRPLGADVCNHHIDELRGRPDAHRVLEQAALRRLQRDNAVHRYGIRP